MPEFPKMRIARGVLRFASRNTPSDFVRRDKNVVCGPRLHPPRGARRNFAVSWRAFFFFALAAPAGLGLTGAAAQTTSFPLSSNAWTDLGAAPMALSVQGGSMQYAEGPAQPPIGTIGMNLEPIVGPIPLGGAPITGGQIEIWGLATGGTPTAVTGPLSSALTVPFHLISGFTPLSSVITLNVGGGLTIAQISSNAEQLVENVSSAALVAPGSAVFCWLSALVPNPNVEPPYTGQWNQPSPDAGQWIASGGGYAVFRQKLDDQYIVCTNGGAVVKVVGGE